MTIKFGDKFLERALREFGEEVEREVKAIIRETVLLIHKEATARAPVDDGTLRQSIVFEFENDGFTGVIDVGADYRVWVEFGTGIHATKGNGRKDGWTYFSKKLNRFVFTEGMKAQPFWFPAVEVGKKYYYKQMKDLFG